MAAKGGLAEKPVEETVTSKLEHSSNRDITHLNCTKDGAMSDATSCISSVDAVCSTKEIESDQEVLVVDQSMYYPMNSFYGYYYPGSDMQFVQWNEQGYMLGTDGLEMQQPVIQPDNGSLVYYVPGFQPAYSFIPEPMVGVDGQYVGQLPHATSPGTPQPLGSPVYYPPFMGYGPEVQSAYGWDASLWGCNPSNGYMGNLTVPATKPKYSTKLQHSKPTVNSKNASLENKGSTLQHPPKVEIPTLPWKPAREAFVPSKGYSHVAKLPSYTCQGKGGLFCPNAPPNVKENGRGWVSTEKFKVRNKFNGLGDVDMLNEQNRGPRTNNSKSTSISGDDRAGSPVSELEDDCCGKTLVVRRDDYNLPDFPTKYEHAMFFIIKSYSEDDIHKSIKYNVWASTPNGNKRLDNAFVMAQEKMGEKGCKCPIFLFFSVNASGQFCGVAEMIGRVNFDKRMDFWQQDKWNGCFPVKWHVIKDVPNPQFRHIILENNDHKPVTNSRDTQEVKFPQGSEILNIFKSFLNKTSILDDFGFYENRQKVMQDKRTKALQPKIEETANVNKSGDLKPIVSSMEVLKLNVSQIATVD